MRGDYEWVCHQGGDAAFSQITLSDLIVIVILQYAVYMKSGSESIDLSSVL